MLERITDFLSHPDLIFGYDSLDSHAAQAQADRGASLLIHVLFDGSAAFVRLVLAKMKTQPNVSCRS